MDILARSLSATSRSPFMNSLKKEMKNATLAAMKEAGVPLNRENYIHWAFAGEPPEGEIDPEIEETFPPQFRRSALDERLTERIQ
jgi:hypothetical protein